MEIKLHTYDIQMLDIALILHKPDTVISEQDIERLSGILIKLNNVCTKENNYTITLNIED